MSQVAIGSRALGGRNPAFLVAEAGINHNGSVDLACRMIDAAKDAGADAVKFQTFRAEEFVADPAQQYTYQSQGRTVTESMLEMFKRHEFTPAQWRTVRERCRQVGITFLSTPQNRTDLDLLLELGIDAIKIGSDDFTNLPLIRSYASTRLPLILSCGMSDMAEVHQALEAAGTFDGYSTVLLVCTSQYPTPPDEANLARLRTLRGAFPNLLVGFSDHTRDHVAAAVAVAYGACLLEKHFTLDHSLPGPDHGFSQDPGELAEWVRTVRTAEAMIGDGLVRPSARELANKREFQRVIVAVRPIEAGDVFTHENLGMRRVPGGRGLPPALLDRVLGKTAARSYRAGDAVEQ